MSTNWLPTLLRPKLTVKLPRVQSPMAAQREGQAGRAGVAAGVQGFCKHACGHMAFELETRVGRGHALELHRGLEMQLQWLLVAIGAGEDLSQCDAARANLGEPIDQGGRRIAAPSAAVQGEFKAQALLVKPPFADIASQPVSKGSLQLTQIKARRYNRH
ncbi:hypothetical protein [Roseateles sp. BYS96W]|uniref:Uncharacterized protein n=1 Tax=Pelomonas nitida TaxID=3299027 RepID=A0ABW7GD46_9BURK